MVCNKFAINLYTLFENYLDGRIELLRQRGCTMYTGTDRVGFYGH